MKDAENVIRAWVAQAMEGKKTRTAGGTELEFQFPSVVMVTEGGRRSYFRLYLQAEPWVPFEEKGDK